MLLPQIHPPLLRRLLLHQRMTSGAALVMVLTALALVSFLALVILTFARNEDRAAKTNSDLDQLRTLAGLPEKMVIHQLRLATDRLNSSGGAGGLVTDSWTSQPGLIRRFGAAGGQTDATTGRVPTREIFKLYSSPEMYYNNGNNPQDNNLSNESNALQQWATKAIPGPFIVDLNEPVLVSSKRQQNSSNTRNQTDLSFPVADPRALGKVDGFALVNTSSSPPTLSYQPPQNNVRLPMPVSWLYVLRDGTVLPVQKVQDDKTISVDKNIATEDNPIVGRIAFWADDDSCKLNINTASEPAPWSPPLANTPADKAYAEAMPAAGEYHRMPGHPAYTSLSPIFRHFNMSNSGFPTNNNVTAETNKNREPFDLMAGGSTSWDNQVKAILTKLPRSIKQDSNFATTGSLSGSQAVVQEVEPREQRLFTSTDELLFNPNRGQNSNIRQEDLEQVGFFLTTHSRAPETNLFNQPKISLWPLPNNFSEHSELDQKFALASFIPVDSNVSPNQRPNNTNVYAFQRGDRWQDGTTLGSSQNPFLEFTYQRNQDLFRYLQTLTNSPIPGFGSTPAEKYGDASRDQLLLSMFDYLRWGVNPQTPQDTSGNLPLQYRYLAPSPNASSTDNPNGLAENSALPLILPGSSSLTIESEDNDASNNEIIKAHGRSPCVSEVALVFTAIDAFPQTPAPTEFYQQTKQILCFVVIEPFQVAPGVPSTSPHLRYMLEWGASGTESPPDHAGDPQLEIIEGTANRQTLALDFTNTSSPLRALHDVYYSSSTNSNVALRGNAAPFGGLHNFFLDEQGMPRTFKPLSLRESDPAAANNFCAVSTQIGQAADGDITNRKLIFTGGRLRLKIMSAQTDPSDPSDDAVLQTLVMDFPSCDMPMPKLKVNNGITPAGGLETNLLARATRFKSGPGAGTERPLCLIEKGDAVRSVQFSAFGPAKGDYRVISGRAVINPFINQATAPVLAAQDYQPSYPPGLTASGSTPAEQIHSLRDGAVALANGTEPTSVAESTGSNPPSPPIVYASLLPLTSAAASSAPAVCPQTDGVFNADGKPGDFDNGPGLIEDGPYLGFSGISSVANESTSGVDPGVGYFDFFSRVGATPADKIGLSRGGPALEEDGLTFAPWNQISSAITFGSLPTSIYGRGPVTSNSASGADVTPRPWQTLLFCPHPASRTAPWGNAPQWLPGLPTQQDHFGFAFPRDHLWLENFWVPAVEPAHITGFFSTEGKVNMNHQLIPFTWIHRSTALHGALHGVRITAIPSSTTLSSTNPSYKDPNTQLNQELRYTVDPDLTMIELDRRFYSGSDGSNVTAGDVYRAPSEICEVPLFPVRLPRTAGAYPITTPDPTNLAELQTWWEGASQTVQTDGMEATGDNTRERPYAQLYPRLCTRSNVFTVHYRVQIISTARSQGPNVFVEDTDGRNIIAEQRGSATIERYLDPSSNNLTTLDFMTTASNLALDDYYSYRVINRQTFAP